MRTLYRKKRKTLLDAIKREFGGHAAVRGENAGLHIILEVKSAPSEEWLTQKALEKGVKVYPASVSYMPPLIHTRSSSGLADFLKKASQTASKS